MPPVDPLAVVRSAVDEGRYHEAADVAGEVAATTPLRTEAHYLQGLALSNLGRDAEALVALRKAIYLDPQHGFAHFLLAGALDRQGERIAAARSYQAAADTLGSRPADSVATELGGRRVAELAALCARLATTGYVTFRLGTQTFAAPLDGVREIVRLAGLEQLPGARAPLAGVIVLRGQPLPVMDVRDPAVERVVGDVLVLDVDGDTVGIAVDAVLAVLDPDQLAASSLPAKLLPAYVVGIRQGVDGPVLLVDLRQLLDATCCDWAGSLTTMSTVAGSG
jgi:chemotaxis signal transduction protein